MSKTTRNHCLSIGLIIFLCYLAYLPGLTDFMLADDAPNISENDTIKISQLNIDNLTTAATTNDSGPLGRPLSYLSFALNYYFSGQQIIPSHFKATNLGIHIANSILVYLLTLILLSTISKRTKLLATNKNLALALLITLLWALHPIQLTAILYSVQRMTSLATFFMLIGLITYMVGRRRLEENQPYALILMYGGVASGTILGTLSKEMALLLPFYVIAVEITIYHSINYSDAIKKQLNVFYLAVAVIPAIIGTIYLASHPELIFSGYKFRDFTLIERLMTEARVVFYYINLIIFPDLSQLSLHHDDISISRNLFAPLTTIFSVLGVIILLLAAWLVRKKYAIFSFMIMWFFIGHAMESTFFGLEIAYEHRNYLPSYGIIFAATLYSYLLLQRITNKKPLKVTMAIVALISMFATTFTRASIWSDEATISHFDARNHPNSSRSQMTYAYYLLKANKPLPLAYEHIRIASRLTTAEIEPIIYLYKTAKMIDKNINNYSENQLENITNPTRYDAPLIINSNYIQELAILINQEIIRRLHGEVSTHRAALALRAFSNCILANNINCTPLTAEAINWLTALSNNARHSPKSLGMTYFFLAKLKAYTADFDAAFYYIEKSLAALPDDFSILTDRINLYITVGDINKANELIRRLEKRSDLPEVFRSELSRSKEYIQTMDDDNTGNLIPVPSNQNQNL